MPKTAEQLAKESENKSYSNLGKTLLILQDNIAEKNNNNPIIKLNEIEKYANALIYLGGEKKTKEKAQENLNILSGFFEYLTRVPKGSKMSNFQILFDESFEEDDYEQFTQNLMRA
ncbi:MAG: hypothetical protein IKO32_06425, partial [Lachnospiraceae bacterium]|nr:hypothetical protein [Lachnospiraceae bacterium]